MKIQNFEKPMKIWKKPENSEINVKILKQIKKFRENLKKYENSEKNIKILKNYESSEKIMKILKKSKNRSKKSVEMKNIEIVSAAKFIGWYFCTNKGNIFSKNSNVFGNLAQNWNLVEILKKIHRKVFNIHFYLKYVNSKHGDIWGLNIAIWGLESKYPTRRKDDKFNLNFPYQKTIYFIFIFFFSKLIFCRFFDKNSRSKFVLYGRRAGALESRERPHLTKITKKDAYSTMPFFGWQKFKVKKYYDTVKIL